MNYKDLSEKVISTTHNMYLVPTVVMDDLVGDNWYLPSIVNDDGFLVDIEDHRLDCVTHTRKGDDSNYQWFTEAPLTEDYFYHMCSVLVDGIPAFFYIYLRHIKCSAPWHHEYTQLFILNTTATKEFMQIVVSMYLDRITIEDGVVVQHVTELDDLEDLTTFSGVGIQYLE